MKTLSAELVAMVPAGATPANLPPARRHRLEGCPLAGRHPPEHRPHATEKEPARIEALLKGAGFAVRLPEPLPGRP